MVPRRLKRLDSIALGGMQVHIARSRRSRLVGLAGLRELPADRALLIPRCRSVHTFGMRFPVDLTFLDACGRVVASVRGVPPNRVVTRRGAAAVLEAGRVPGMAEETPSASQMRAALDPRRRIYRDPFNEYLLFVLSAGGAIAGTQVPLYIVMALSDNLWSLWGFVGACVLFELGVIFGIARPAMKPIEAAGWALLWTFTTAVLAICFWYLVAEPTL